MYQESDFGRGGVYLGAVVNSGNLRIQNATSGFIDDCLHCLDALKDFKVFHPFKSKIPFCIA